MWEFIVMPPKRIEDLPVVDSVGRSHSTSDGGTDSSCNACIRTQRRDTRATHGNKLRRHLDEKGKIPVTFRKVDGRPTGEYGAAFMTELGVAVKKFAPLQVSDWRKVTEEQKRPIFDRLESTFTVDFGTGPDSVKKETDKLMNTRFRDNRQRMHKHYKSLAHLPWEERLKDIPFDYCDNEQDWEFMCTIFDSESFKKRSTTNKKNRAKLPYNHRGGSRSFIQYSYGGGSQRKDRITVFNETHYSSKKGWIGAASTVYDNMVQLREKYEQTQLETDTPDEVTQPVNKFEIADRVCDEVLGKRSGYIRGLGNGPKPAMPVSSDSSSRRSTNAELRNELQDTRVALQSTQDEVKRLRTEQQLMREVIERIAPGALQSMSQPPSSSASPPPPL